MNEADVNPVLTGHEVRELQLLIEQRSGIMFDESRERFLTTRVVEHMQRKRLNYGLELLRLVRGSNVEYDNMLERLLTQETSFLRYPALFSAFEKQVVPELLERKFWDKDGALRIWSAGCASGEEPYSIALSICDAAGLGAVPPVSIMATDVSREALERAARGVYSRRALENLSPSQIGAYFIPRRAFPGEAGAAQHGEVCSHEPGAAGVPGKIRLHLLHERADLLRRGAALQTDPALLRISGAGRLPLPWPRRIGGQRAGKFQQKFINGARLLQKPLHHLASSEQAVGNVQ